MTRQARFCIRCGSRLEPKDDHGHLRPTCPTCGTIHYRNPAPAAGALLRTQAGVLLVRRKFDPAAGAWCIPAGFMEYGESPQRCAVRELQEETGLRVRLTGLFGVYAGFDDPRVRAVLILYTAEKVGGRLRPGDDAIEARYWPLGRAPRRIAFAAHRRALQELQREVSGGGDGRRGRPAKRGASST